MTDTASTDQRPRPPEASDAPPRGRLGRLLDAIDALPLELFLMMFLRLSAAVWLVTGLVHWARIVEYLPWRGRVFGDMPLEWQSAIVFYGVLDLVTAVGLWLATGWGVALWVVAIVCQILTHGAMAEIFGERPFRIPFYIVSVIAYAFLWWRVQAIRRRRREADGF